MASLSKTTLCHRGLFRKRGLRRDLQNLGALLDTEPHEETKLDDSDLTRIDPRQRIQRVVQFDNLSVL